jgi:hypothetical protein
VAQHITEGADFLPWLIGHKAHGDIAQLPGGLRNAFKAAFHSVVDHPVFFEGR